MSSCRHSLSLSFRPLLSARVVRLAPRLLAPSQKLLQEGSERRLNVAITRARHRMTVVSSFSHHDMAPSRSKSRGVELLRLYLQYAASKGTILGDSGQSNVPMNPFEEDVCNALTAKGIELLPQWGVSRYRLDFAAKHPQKPGRFVLAIECDGATYHSSPTARDRDRLRQQHLERLGWRFHRIWSTDWFMEREKEIKRTVTAWKRAVALADQEDKRRQQIEQDAKESSAQKSTSSEHQAPKHLLRHEINTSQRKRGRRPKVPNRKKIKEYSRYELDKLVRWIKSDGRLRTNEEIITQMIPELGFKRRGPRIVEAIEAAIERTGER